MRTLSSTLREGYEQHVAVLERGSQTSVPVGAIRGRRIARTFGAGAAGVTVAGGLVLGYSALSRPTDAPADAPSATSQCGVDPYLLPNPGAFGPLWKNYLGRVFADFDSGAALLVRPDGTREVLTPDPDGGFHFTAHKALEVRFGIESGGEPVFEGRKYLDFSITQGGYSVGVFDWDNAHLWEHSAYQWTMTMPSEVPAGVNALALADLLGPTYGFPGGSFSTSSLPPDAQAMFVVYRTGEPAVATVLQQPQPVPDLQSLEGLERVEIQVTGLEGGEEFAITLSYDATAVPGFGCDATV